MNLTIQIKGLDNLIKVFGRAEKNLPVLVGKALEKSSFFVWKALSANTPEDTGRLRDSNRREISAWEASIGPDVAIAPYAMFVENGHHTRSGGWVPGQHYIQRTQLETSAKVIDIFEGVFRQLFK